MGDSLWLNAFVRIAEATMSIGAALGGSSNAISPVPSVSSRIGAVPAVDVFTFIGQTSDLDIEAIVVAPLDKSE
jgi:hypothetical protein